MERGSLRYRAPDSRQAEGRPRPRRGDGLGTTLAIFTVNRNPSTRDLRWFALGMFPGFTGIAALVVFGASILVWFKGGQPDWSIPAFGSARLWIAMAFVALGAFLSIGGLMPRPIATKVYVGWMRLVTPVGIFMSMVMLSLVYFLFLPVFALIVRRNDPLRLRNRGETSYWMDAKPAPKTIDDMMRFS